MITNQNRKLARSTALIAGAALTLTTLSGCLVSSHSSEKETGTRIGSTTINQIEPGSTTKNWVLSALGEPTTKSTFTPEDADRAGEIWVYEYEKVRSSSGAIFLIFGGSSKKTTNLTHHVEFIDNVVNRVWSD